MANKSILVVDDDAVVRSSLSAVLVKYGYNVTTAASVVEALRAISTHSFDVLLSDLHMPGRGDGLTVVSAMRHANPKAATMLLSAFPEMDVAAQAILLQTDRILVKPMRIPALIEAIEEQLSQGPSPVRTINSVATILESSIQSTVDAWLIRVGKDQKLTVVAMSSQERTGHVPIVLEGLVRRLRSASPLGEITTPSAAAIAHGTLRCQQGYSASMLVEESRMLQVSIFETLQKHLASIDFSLLLGDVMSIADEVDSQLSQAMDSFGEETRRLARTK